MDRRERILGKGYLIKSPVKNSEKSSFARFWKRRWLVLTEVLFVDVNEFVEESKLVFSYYKDKDSHVNDEQPKGRPYYWFKFIEILSCLLEFYQLYN